MEQRELWQSINEALVAANYRWRGNELWDSFSLNNRVSPMHQALSGIATVTGDSMPVLASVDFSGDDYESAAFEAIVWTSTLAVRAVREPGADVVEVGVHPRSSLTELTVVRAPIITASGFQSRDDRGELRLGYPTWSATVKRAHGQELMTLLPSFVEDLSA